MLGNFDRVTGNIKVLARKIVVEEIKDPRLEISLEAARKWIRDMN